MMTIIAKYDDFVIFRDDDDGGKLFVSTEFDEESYIACSPTEVREVHRVPFPISEQYSDAELIALCPEEYDYSGEPINESDYVFWKCVDSDNETYLTDITGTLGEWFDTDFIGVPDTVISLLQDAYALAVQELSK